MQPISNIKSIVNDAVNTAFRNKALVEKGQSSIVVFGLAEKNNDKADINSLLGHISNHHHIIKFRRLGAQSAQTSVKSIAPPTVRTRPLLIELLDAAEQSAILLSARNLKGTIHNNVYIRRWLSVSDRDHDKLLRSHCSKLNAKYPSDTVGKNRFSVINGHIRERRANGSINFTKTINHDLLLRDDSINASNPTASDTD
jgi:hypothetical protein